MALATNAAVLLRDQLLMCLLLLFLAFIVSVIIRRIWFHPLSAYPGPYLARFSQFYTYLGTFRQNRTILQYELLQKYGSPCRIATNELVFSDHQSIADIYGQSSQPCTKDPTVYDAFTVTGARNVFNVVDRGLHGRMRRLLAHGFSANSLLEREDLLAAKIEDYIGIVYRGNEGRVIDVYVASFHLFLDIISLLGLGKSFDTLRGHNWRAAEDVEAFGVVVPAAAFFPGIRYLPVNYIREGLRGVQRLATHSRACVNEYLQLVNGDTGIAEKGSERTLLDNLATATDEETGTTFTTEELVEHAILFLFAGSGTTAGTTTYFLWECGRRPEVRQRLVQEIRAAFPDPNIMPTYAQASKLPYLNNAINEVFRLWGPLTVGAPRVSPGRMIGGKYILAGVVVGNNPYATARDPKVYANPLHFDPSRWDHSTPEMRAMNRPFSTGPRNCIGRHLATITLVLTLARLYQLYDIVPDPSMTEDKMRLRDRGTFTPWDESLLVTATKAKFPTK